MYGSLRIPKNKQYKTRNIHIYIYIGKLIPLVNYSTMLDQVAFDSSIRLPNMSVRVAGKLGQSQSLDEENLRYGTLFGQDNNLIVMLFIVF